MENTERKMYWKDGFYDQPSEGAVEITEQYWVELLEGNSKGKRIVSDNNGYPILQDTELQSKEELNLIEIERLKSELASTDWAVTKCIELGLSFVEKYPEMAESRAGIRERINQLQLL